MTNKHFFEDDDNQDNSQIIVTNDTFSFKCKFTFMPNNLIDIAIVEMIDKKYMDKLEPIKIRNKKVEILQEVYAVNYSYFDLTDVLEFKQPFHPVKFIKLERSHYQNIQTKKFRNYISSRL